MANILNTDKQIAVIAALTEGSSIRSIERMTGVHSTHVQSVPAKEEFQGKTIWDGIVEASELHGHPKAIHAYAWTHETDDPKQPKRSVTVLMIPPAASPETAVRVAAMQELRDAEAAEA
jgi:hypothetical protein